MRIKITRRVKSFLKRVILNLLTTARRAIPKRIAAAMLRRIGIEVLERPPELGQVVRVCNYKGGAKAAFCISIDFDNFQPWLYEHSSLIDESTTLLLTLADNYQVPMSWAVCGVTAELQPRSLQAILSSRIPHDVGIHTFHHIDCSNPSLSKKDLMQEVADCKEILGLNPNPVTFIFPWDRVAHLDLLKEMGFVVYRGKEIKLGYPKRANGFWNVHPFSLQAPIDPHLHQKSYKNIRFLKGAIDMAIAFGGVFHVYTHPWNIDFDGKPSLYTSKVLEPLFDHAHKRMLEGKLWICTLRELANYCEAKMNCTIERCDVHDGGISVRVSCRELDKRFDFPPAVTLAFDLPYHFRPKVFVDGVEASNGKDYRLAKTWRKTRLFLMLSFERATKEIEVHRGNGRG